jgi:isopenicillin N synthase-like dioxygenase
VPARIPTIDISPWRTGDRAAQDAVAEQIDEACRTVGFLHLAGHVVPAGMIAELLAAMDDFFSLPLEAKSTLQPPTVDINRGYAPSGAEGLGYSLGDVTPPDLFEAFNVGPDAVDPADPAVAAELGGVFAPNIWPTADVHPAAAGFRRAIVTYFATVRRQADELLDIYARALGMPDGYFREFTTHSTDVLRLNHYASGAGTDPATTGQLGMGAHSDYGITTVLLADPVPGLEVLMPDRGWTPVVPRPGHLLVNLGDLLAQWTNDRWRSTLHRVQPAAAGQRRRSAAFFHDGNHDALIECLPTCSSADEPPKYAPVVAGEHVQSKLLGPREGRVSDAVSTIGDRRT